MIEYAEARYITAQIELELKGKKIIKSVINKDPHRFAWFNKEVAEYERLLKDVKIKEAKQNGSMMRIILESDDELVFGEDIVFSYHDVRKDTGKNQLMLFFDHGMVLEVKAKLYGFFLLGKNEELISSNQYFKGAMHSIGVLDKDFSYDYFMQSTKMHEKKGSVKEALATNQHLPGIGNGTIQDVLFDAKIRPERKISTLSDDEMKGIYKSLVQKIKAYVEYGGRDNTTDLFGRNGGYKVFMSSARLDCPLCNSLLVKKAYLGGKVIYCPNCQK